MHTSIIYRHGRISSIDKMSSLFLPPGQHVNMTSAWYGSFVSGHSRPLKKIACCHCLALQRTDQSQAKGYPVELVRRILSYEFAQQFADYTIDSNIHPYGQPSTSHPSPQASIFLLTRICPLITFEYASEKKYKKTQKLTLTKKQLLRNLRLYTKKEDEPS